MENKKKKVLKYFGAFFALIMVAVVSVTGTLAYLSKKTVAEKNTFTGSGDIGLEVVEEQWDATGEAKASQYTPGLEIPKDPALQNTTGTDYSEWVAIRVDYYQGTPAVAVSYANFAKQDGEEANTTKVIEGISFNDTDWYDITPDGATYQVFAYNSKLGNGVKTSTLFDNVQINTKLEKGVGYPQFDIYISGAAIKVEDAHGGITNLKTSIEANDTEAKNIKTALLELLASVDGLPS